MTSVAPPPDGELTLLHFNDVYNLPPTEREPVGGAARFAHLLHQLVGDAAERHSECAVLFSGDALSPSVLANAMKGKHMVPVLNQLHIAAACIGNHDLDHGLQAFEASSSRMNFPWLVSNARLRRSGRPLGECTPFVVITRGLWRIGVMGLIEREWLDTLSTLDASAVEYDDFIPTAARVSETLRQEHGCQVVIALTHMRVHNDAKLAAAAGGYLDLILGGHDHDYIVDLTPSAVPIIKSDSDFRALSRVRLSRVDAAAAPAPLGGVQPVETHACSTHRWHVCVERFNVTRSVEEDAAMRAVVAESEAFLGTKMAAVIGVTRVPLVAGTTAIRTRETNVGSFVTDLMRQAVDADVALLNGGTFRIGHDIRAGILKLSDLVELLPLQDPTVKVAMPGSVLLAALETSVGKWPATEGRFCQVSGIRFAFDPAQPPGARIVPGSVFTHVSRRRGSLPGAHASDDDEPLRCVEDAPLHAEEEDADDSDLGEAARAWAFGAPGSARVDLQNFYDARDIAATLTQSLSAPTSPAGGAHDTDSIANKARPARPGMHHSESAPDVTTPMAVHTDASGAGEMPHASAATARGYTGAHALAHDSAAVTVTPHGGLRMTGVPAATGGATAWHPLDMDATYTVATKSYIAEGRDGFDCFRDPRVHTLIAADNGPILPTIVRNHFRVLAALSGFNSMDASHPASMLNARRTMPRRTHLCRHARSEQTGAARMPSAPSSTTPDVDTPQPHGISLPPPIPRRYALAIAPRVDGRISIVAPDAAPTVAAALALTVHH